MKQYMKHNWKLLMFFSVIGLLGGFILGIYSMESYPPEIRQELAAQGIDDLLLAAVTAAQSALYGLVLGGFGILLAQKIGLWRETLHWEKGALTRSAAAAVLGGVAMILPDILFFGKYSEVIANSYLTKPSIAFILASITYGAVIEEVMLRLFVMSLIAWLLHTLLERQKAEVSPTILICANIISALLFAAGHLPATFLLMGSSPLLIFRCFLLNGGLGLVFGRLYRKYGLQYAMLAHGGCHVVSKLIWIVFL